MKLSEFPVLRPVTVAMMMLIIVVLGGVSLLFLKVDLMPQLEFPNVVIIVEYPGAAPQEVEQLVSKPIESVVRTVSGIKKVKSSSMEGAGLIIAEFGWDVDLNTAIAGVREKIGAVQKYLPDEAENPLVMKFNLSEMPVLFMYVHGDRSLADLQSLTKDVIAPELEKIDGVAQAMAVGGRRREIQVRLNQDRLLAYKLPTEQIIQRIRFENLNVSGGIIGENNTRYTVRSVGEFTKLAEIEGLVVGYSPEGAKIHLRDVAQVVDTFADAVGVSRVNQQQGIGILVRKESDANLIEVSEKVEARMPHIFSLLPDGVEMGVSFDTSSLILDSIHALRQSAIEGAVLVVVILLIFLGSLRPTLIVSLSIPLSLLTAFVFMYFGDLTINIMTLGGLLIALGKLVDDSIVVMENIDRNRALGYGPREASIRGTSEVFIAVLGATAATVIVFLPMAFSTGIAGQMFKPFGLTVFYALGASLLIAFTLVPMMASKFLKDDSHAKGTGKPVKQGWFSKVEDFYEKVLIATLDRKWAVGLAGILILAATAWMTGNIGKEFIPRLVAGMYESKIKMPVGTDLEATTKVVARAEQYIAQFPDVENIMAMIGTSDFAGEAAAMQGEMQGSFSASMMMRFGKGEKRVTPGAAIMALAENLKEEVPTVDIRVYQVGDILFGNKRPVEIQVEGNDFAVMRRIADDAVAMLREVPGVKNPSHSLQRGTPEVQLKYDRSRLSGHGLLVGQVAMNVRSKIEGTVASRFREGGDEYDIRVMLSEDERNSLTSIGEMDVWSPGGYAVPVRDFADTELTQGPGVITREDARRLITVGADTEGRPLSEVIADVQARLESFRVPEGYRLNFGGQFADMQDSFFQLGIVAIMAILLVYMILASLYESLIHPLTIMLPIPFAVTGGIALLYLTGTPLGVTAFIGFIMLIGIVATNSIVLLDFIIAEERRLKNVREAIRSAARKRLRPILITSLTTGFGMLPVALGLAEGMEVHVPLGRVVVGGLVTSTLLTLVVVPSIYEIFDRIARTTQRAPAPEGGA